MPGRALMTRMPTPGPAPPGLCCHCRPVPGVLVRDPVISGLNSEQAGAVGMVMEKTRWAGLNWRQGGPRVAGAGLLAATGAIHLDLYLTGYRSIPVIGWLFLLQVIAAFGLAAAVLVSGSRLAAAAGAGFALSTLGGYLLSVQFGLFGFKEVRTTAGIVAGVIEVAAFAALAVLALSPAAQRPPARPAASRSAVLARLQAGVPGAGRAAAAVSVAALVLLGISVAGAGGPGPSAAGALQTAKIGGVTVLTNASGFTLYWFAPDTPAKSNCNSSCAAYWPPVTGTPAAGPGVPGRLGTIKRSDGTTQATYDGHPLYTYIGDNAPGRAHGNNINLNGGLWHEVTATG
jgi:predicted lipoprotein with Yx(FWY)xxD motif